MDINTRPFLPSFLSTLALVAACGDTNDPASQQGDTDTDTAASSGAEPGGPTAEGTGSADESGSTGSSGDAQTGEPPPAQRPFEELYAQGIDRYIGAFEPSSSQPIDGGVLHQFTGDDGPLCFTGAPFDMTTREASGDALLIFAQGGGVCGPNACEAVESWPPGILSFGLLDPSVPGNPVADFDVGYIPYCDGSLFSGDVEVDLDDDGVIDRSHRGLANLSASLDVIASTFPEPSRILLAGNSAGGFGTHYALPLVRLLYPDVPIDLVNDSGVGIGNPGGQGTLNAYWGAEAFYPASCADCIGADGNLTGYHAWQLDEDPNVRMGFLSSTADDVVVSGLGMDPEMFEAQLREAMAELEDLDPERVRSLIAGDDSHTFILRQFEREVGGQAVKDWLGAMVTGSEDWVSVAD